MKLNQLGALSTQTAILIAAGLISFSILLGDGVIKIKGLSVNKGETAAAPSAQAPTTPDQQPPAAPTGPVAVSLDDDPMIGDKNAPVTIVEFSDYECPFCKRHYDQTYIPLKKDYIDTGKVKLVYRDLPLSFHDPMATTEAIAASCAREQGGDSAYFKFHDTMFTKTTSNGSGLTKDQLYGFAAEQGLDSAKFKSCLDSEKYKDEVAKDLADATKYGASGTPSFFVGKSAENFQGKIIVGAQPYTTFQAEIDALLK